MEALYTGNTCLYEHVTKFEYAQSGTFDEKRYRYQLHVKRKRYLRQKSSL